MRVAKLLWLYVDATLFGDPDASYGLGEARLTGDFAGMPVRKNARRAARWYERGARSGHRESQYELAFMCLLGEGIDRDRDAGVRWMTRAANAGHPEAMRVLADGYSKGALGIEPSPALASMWSQKLAAHLESHPDDRRAYERE